ncbi:unnamed protein product [Auanema sp. JU1783]|nr:unnamed protein product [Auanema sp. JU1783]
MLGSGWVSTKAVLLRRKFNEVHNNLRMKFMEMEMSSNALRVYSAALYDSIEEINRLIVNPLVRDHKEPNLLKPEVNANSPAKLLLQRLRRQVRATCMIADDIQNGSEANATEAEVLTVVEQELDKLYDILSPDTSIRGLETIIPLIN